MNSTISTTPISIYQKSKTIDSVSVFIAGIGAIGSTLVHQILKLDHAQIQINIIGYCNSRYTIWNPDSDDSLIQFQHQNGSETDWTLIPQELFKSHSEKVIFVDATGSKTVALQYKSFLENGIHVVTASKLANTFDQQYFDDLMTSNLEGKAHYRYETTVGAGLPVINTIKSLIESGDEITEISGVVSGTMTYLFHQIQAGISFSDAVQKAKELGYSEPDPRDDLSGEDVARKFLILARTCGFKIERDQIKVKSLFPDEYSTLSTSQFLKKLHELNSYWNQANAKANVNNKKLQYVGKVTSAGIEIGIQEVKSESPLGGLTGTDNLIQINSKRYADSPIVIQGPGAGKVVTAAGVLSDVIEVAKGINKE